MSHIGQRAAQVRVAGPSPKVGAAGAFITSSSVPKPFGVQPGRCRTAPPGRVLGAAGRRQLGCGQPAAVIGPPSAQPGPAPGGGGHPLPGRGTCGTSVRSSGSRGHPAAPPPRWGQQDRAGVRGQTRCLGLQNHNPSSRTTTSVYFCLSTILVPAGNLGDDRGPSPTPHAPENTSRWGELGCCPWASGGRQEHEGRELGSGEAPAEGLTAPRPAAGPGPAAAGKAAATVTSEKSASNTPTRREASARRTARLRPRCYPQRLSIRDRP